MGPLKKLRSQSIETSLLWARTSTGCRLPAYSSILLNLIAVATFIIAIVLRAEKLAQANYPGKMKLLGSLLYIGGAMMVSLLKGRPLHLWPTNLMGYSNSQAPTADTAFAELSKTGGQGPPPSPELH